MTILGHVVGTAAAHLLSWELWVTVVAVSLLPISSVLCGLVAGTLYSGLNYLGVSRLMAELGRPSPNPTEALVPFVTAGIVALIFSLGFRKLWQTHGAQ
jgi:hypothetical protein